MPALRLLFPPTPSAPTFADLRRELGVVEAFPPAVLAEAAAAARDPRLPDADETGVPFLTVDPPESRDLDQAVHLERSVDGYRVRYAIADVAAFVRPGGARGTEAPAPRTGTRCAGALAPVPGRGRTGGARGRWRPAVATGGWRPAAGAQPRRRAVTSIVMRPG